MRLRVEEIVDAMVASRVEITDQIAAQAGAVREMVENVATLVEQNALRVTGRLGE